MSCTVRSFCALGRGVEAAEIKTAPCSRALPGHCAALCPIGRAGENGPGSGAVVPGSTGAVGARAGETCGRLTRPGAQGTIGQSNCKGEDKPCFGNTTVFSCPICCTSPTATPTWAASWACASGCSPPQKGRGSSSRRCWPACAGMESTAWRRARWRLRPAFPWTQRAGRR